MIWIRILVEGGSGISIRILLLIIKILANSKSFFGKPQKKVFFILARPLRPFLQMTITPGSGVRSSIQVITQHHIIDHGFAVCILLIYSFFIHYQYGLFFLPKDHVHGYAVVEEIEHSKDEVVVEDRKPEIINH